MDFPDKLPGWDLPTHLKSFGQLATELDWAWDHLERSTQKEDIEILVADIEKLETQLAAVQVQQQTLAFHLEIVEYIAFDFQEFELEPLGVGFKQPETSKVTVSSHDNELASTEPTPSVSEEELIMSINKEIIGAPPADWKGDDNNPNFRAIGTLSPAEMRKVEPVGASFLAFARRKRHNRTFSEDDRIQASKQVKNIEEQDAGEISEEEDPAMLQRDAKDWKGQDHYAVLGLSKYRWKATEAQIKAANRKKVLKHHPDKKAAAGMGDDNDSFFKCIQRATEILLDPVKRRQFDSVDEAADVEPPTKKDLTKPSSFYKKWGKVFESEGRFSKKQPVPSLGNADSTEEEVDAFYNFFYDFDSWRSFEYLDEDVPDDNEARDHKRHVERKNANARRKRKTEDTARLRHLVDDCLAMDERIKKFQQAKRAGKDKKRLEREAAEKQAAEEKAKAIAEAERKLKEEEEKAKADREASKKAKEAAKTAVKKNKRVVKGSVKDVNYFSDGTASASQIDQVLNDVDAILAKVDPDELADLVSKLNVAGKDGNKVKEVFTAEAGRLSGAGKVKAGDLKVFA